MFAWLRNWVARDSIGFSGHLSTLAWRVEDRIEMAKGHRIGSDLPVRIDLNPSNLHLPTRVMNSTFQNYWRRYGTPPQTSPSRQMLVQSLPFVNRTNDPDRHSTILEAVLPPMDVVRSKSTPPRPRQHSLVLSNLQNLYCAVYHVISPELTPATPLDHSAVESVRVFVVEHLAHIARAQVSRCGIPAAMSGRCVGIVYCRL